MQRSISKTQKYKSTEKSLKHKGQRSLENAKDRQVLKTENKQRELHKRERKTEYHDISDDNLLEGFVEVLLTENHFN